MLIADPAAVLESPVLCGWDDVWDHTSVPPCLLRSRAWRSVVAMKGVSVRNFHVKVDIFFGLSAFNPFPKQSCSRTRVWIN